MKSIDDLKFSDDSYDVDIVRKNSKDFVSSQESQNSSINSFSIFDPNFKNQPKELIEIDASVEAKYGITLCNHASSDKEMLNYTSEQYLILFDQVSNDEGCFYKAKNSHNQLGLINTKNVLVIKGNSFIKLDYLL